MTVHDPIGDPIGDLAQIWEDLLREANATHREEVLCFGYLIGQYAAPARCYHGLGHLVELMKQADGLQFRDPVSVRLAVFYHDCVYEARRGVMSNEVQSAEIAAGHLAVLGFSPAVIARTVELIRLTETHEVDAAKDPDAALFLDMDMSILGAPAHIYDRYAWDIRLEYASVETMQFCEGRLDFINRTLARPRIFLSDSYEKQYGAQARENLAREKQVIEATGKPLFPKRPDRIGPSPGPV